MNCRTCKKSEIEKVLHFPKVPLVGDFLERPMEHLERYDIDLYFCTSCSLLQIAESIDSNRLFKEYSFSSSTVKGLVNHFNEYAIWIKSKLQIDSILEIGSNDGVLLEPLEKNGIKAFGLDISENITQIALDKGLKARVGKFSVDEIDKLFGWCGKVDAITASNTFPHNADPHDFLDAVNGILKPRGHLLLEVMYAGSLLEQTQWDTVYHEHLNFHSLTSLSNLLEMHDLYVNYAEVIPMHAGSLRIIASSIRERDESVNRILLNEAILGLSKIESWQSFAKRTKASIEKCSSELERLAKTRKIWAYGASGRASMWLNVCNLHFIEKIVDSSPLRYGKYIPGMNTPIVPPTDAEFQEAEVVFVTAWNYIDDIIKQHPNLAGEWIVPLPTFERRKA